MLISSIVSILITSIWYANASLLITSYKLLLFLSVSFFESLIKSFEYPLGKIQAATTNGPAKGPLPASSLPAINVRPCS